MILMNNQRLLIAIIFLNQVDLLALGQIYCQNNNGNYTRNSTYSVNLNATLSSLYTNVNITGFYNASIGEGINRANALALCRGDIQLNTCRECIQKAVAQLLQSCPNQKQAIRWDMDNNMCIVRYSNATMIHGAMEIFPKYYMSNVANATSADRFEQNLRNLLDDLRGKAAGGGSLRKFAGANATAPDFQRIYAFVQCTPDLSPEDCTSCLSNAATDIPSYCNRKVGCRVLSPSCILHFEIYPFLNETRLQELEAASAPPPVIAPPPAPTLPSPGKNNGITTPTIIIIIVVSVVVCLIVAVLAIVLLRKRQKLEPIKTHQSEGVDGISTAESLQYTLSTIKVATNDFSDDNKLGQGGFGIVYKGKLPSGQEIAVKRLSLDSGQGDLEFKNEVVLLANLQHRNLVRLLGFVLDGIERLLVYEFVENASLDHFIFDRNNHLFLDCDRRYKIVKGIARGILYLHEDSQLRIIHRDLKASNILLDREMNPKITDFGMARLFGRDETQGNTSRVVGTYGYMAPEYLMHGLFSIKSDVFSFGVLVLEIISGRKNNNFRNGESLEDLLSFTWKHWREGTALNVVDPLLRSGSGSITEMLRCIHIGLLCVQENDRDRPTMASVVLMLSSLSITLTVPYEPAFYFPSHNASDVSLVQAQNSRDPEHTNTTKSEYNDDSRNNNLRDPEYNNNPKYYDSSQNEASITELHGR